MSNYAIHKEDGEIIVRQGYCFLCGGYPEKRVPLNPNGTHTVPLCQNCLKKYNEGGKSAYIEHIINYVNIIESLDGLEKKINRLETILEKVVEFQKMAKHEGD